jgi:hypothetical protein
MNHYDNPSCKTLDVFNEDVNRVIHIKRLLNRIIAGEDVSLRLVLNHFIILFNTFDREAAMAMLFFKNEQDKWSLIRTFLRHINQEPVDIIPYLNVPVNMIPINKKILARLDV